MKTPWDEWKCPSCGFSYESDHSDNNRINNRGTVLSTEETLEKNALAGDINSIRKIAHFLGSPKITEVQWAKSVHKRSKTDSVSVLIGMYLESKSLLETTPLILRILEFLSQICEPADTLQFIPFLIRKTPEEELIRILEIMKKCPSDEVIESLKKIYRFSSTSLKYRIIEVVGQRNDIIAIKTLIGFLRYADSDDEKSRIIRTLSGIADAESVAPIKVLLADSSETVRIEVIRTFSELKFKKSINSLKKLYESSSSAAEHREIVIAFKKMGEKIPYSLIQKKIRDSDEKVRKTAFEALTDFHKEKATDLLLDVIRNPISGNDQISALRILGRSGKIEMTPVFIQLLRNRRNIPKNNIIDTLISPDGYITALMSDAQSGNVAATDALLSFLDIPSEQLNSHIINKMKDCNLCLERFFCELCHDDSVSKTSIIPVIGKLQDQRGIEILQRWLEDPLPYEKPLIIEALGKINNPRSVKILENLMKTDEEQVIDILSGMKDSHAGILISGNKKECQTKLPEKIPEKTITWKIPPRPIFSLQANMESSNKHKKKVSKNSTADKLAELHHHDVALLILDDLMSEYPNSAARRVSLQEIRDNEELDKILSRQQKSTLIGIIKRLKADLNDSRRPLRIRAAIILKKIRIPAAQKIIETLKNDPDMDIRMIARS